MATALPVRADSVGSRKFEPNYQRTCGAPASELMDRHQFDRKTPSLCGILFYAPPVVKIR